MSSLTSQLECPPRPARPAAAQRAGCYKLALTSNKQRPDAHRFYRRLGFRATHEGFRIDL